MNNLKKYNNYSPILPPPKESQMSTVPTEPRAPEPTSTEPRASEPTSTEPRAPATTSDIIDLAEEGLLSPTVPAKLASLSPTELDDLIYRSCSVLKRQGPAWNGDM